MFFIKKGNIEINVNKMENNVVAKKYTFMLKYSYERRR